MSDAVTLTTRNGTTSAAIPTAPLLSKCRYIHLKHCRGGREALGLGLRQSCQTCLLQELKADGEVTSWASIVPHARDRGSSRKILKVFLGACTRNGFPCSNAMNFAEEVQKLLSQIKAIQTSSRQEVRFVHGGRSS